jgi:hypothetical protein
MDNEIHNWYEKMVREKLVQMTEDFSFGSLEVDEELLSDIACVALNRLPPKYFRHAVDMCFYLSEAEQNQMDVSVQVAIEEAIAYVVEKARDFQHEGDHADNNHAR